MLPWWGAVESIRFKPSSDGLPGGLLDQPFYGWVECRHYYQPVLTSFTGPL